MSLLDGINLDERDSVRQQQLVDYFDLVASGAYRGETQRGHGVREDAVWAVCNAKSEEADLILRHSWVNRDGGRRLRN